jgi:ribosomal silencing factor RsfS
LQEVLDLLNEKKAENISILDSNVLTALKTLCRFMVIISCSSRRHMKVVADHVSEHYKLKGLLIEVDHVPILLFGNSRARAPTSTHALFT